MPGSAVPAPGGLKTAGDHLLRVDLAPRPRVEIGLSAGRVKAFGAHRTGGASGGQAAVIKLRRSTAHTKEFYRSEACRPGDPAVTVELDAEEHDGIEPVGTAKPSANFDSGDAVASSRAPLRVASSGQIR